jgi:hypothetical protein
MTTFNLKGDLQMDPIEELDIQPIEVDLPEQNQLSVFDKIKDIAEKNGIDINDAPKSNCKKCFGRGFTGHRKLNYGEDLKEPIPCQCIFTKEVLEKDKDNADRNLKLLTKKQQRKILRRQRKKERQESI